MTLNIVVFGLSITSSWGNGHATTFRALLKALAARGHKITFLERDVPWYADNRDMPAPPFCELQLYGSLDEVPQRFGKTVADADLVIVGSYVPEGATLGKWVTRQARGVTAFYDIDTPVTLAKLKEGPVDYLEPELIARYDLYLSFTGGPTLTFIESHYGSRHAAPLYCAVDPEIHAPVDVPLDTALGYLGTYSTDRQPSVERMLLQPARAMPDSTFIVAGAQYPADVDWPGNVTHIEHLPPAEHPAFYSRQRFTLNVTRADMIAVGYSPSVRLFEAAACGVPIISDAWDGLDTLFVPGMEILIAESTGEVLQILREMPEDRRRAIAAAARRSVLQNHTAHHRALQLEDYYQEAAEAKRKLRRAGKPAAIAAGGKEKRQAGRLLQA
jgi:spore maturation protein CgeB